MHRQRILLIVLAILMVIAGVYHICFGDTQPQGVVVGDEVFDKLEAAKLVMEARTYDPLYAPVEKADPAKAIMFYEKAIKSQPEAAINAVLADRVGQIYAFYEGKGSVRNIKKASEWWNRAITMAEPNQFLWAKLHVGIGSFDNILKFNPDTMELPTWKVWPDSSTDYGKKVRSREKIRLYSRLMNLKLRAVDRIYMRKIHKSKKEALDAMRDVAKEYKGTLIGNYASKKASNPKLNSILHFTNRWGIFECSKKITIGLRSGPGVEPDLLYLEGIKFEPTPENTVNATFYSALKSYPKNSWTIYIELLEENKNKVAGGSVTLQNSGEISSFVATNKTEKTIGLGPVDDISKVKFFHVQCESHLTDRPEEIELNYLFFKKKIPRSQVDFENLLVDFSGIWIGGQKPKLKIFGNGLVEFSMNKLPGKPGRYKTTFNLKQEHMIRLNKLLEKTEWLTKPGANVKPNYTCASRIDITLKQKGTQTNVWCHDRNPEPYGSLVNFLKRIYKQEYFLYRITKADEKERKHAFWEIGQELKVMDGEPIAISPIHALDHERFVPVCIEVIKNTRSNYKANIEIALRLLGLFCVESQRETITELTTAEQVSSKPNYSREKTIKVQIAAIDALARLGGQQAIQHLRGLAGDQEKKKVWVNDAIVKALLKLDGINSIDIFKSMLRTTPSAGLALIRLGEPAIPAIIDILKQSHSRDDLSQIYLIRQYIDNWKTVNKPVDQRVINAVKANLDSRLEYSTSWTEYHKEFLKLTAAHE